jgi:NAD(P)-dependent dehydrogenase (short-subunit alcohol dehydrogenase family)
VRVTQDKTAFVTGGASGIGLGMAHSFLRAGMRVAMADVRAEALQSAAATLAAGDRLHTLQLDVTDRAAMEAAAVTVENVFGPVHVLCNNAGVGMLGGIKSMTYDDWDWCLSVNLGGTVNGLQTFLPRMLAHGQGGHIVNTSSIGAISPGPGGIAYLTAKAALVTLSESLRMELQEDGIGVTVLVPGPTRTRINEVGSLRPARFQNTGLREVEEQLARTPLFDNGLDPLEVGGMVLDAVRRDLMYVFTHNDFKAGVAQRFEAILAAFPGGPVDPERGRRFGFPLVNPLYAELLRRGEPPAQARPEQDPELNS